MKIYLVSGDEYEQRYIDSAFSDKDKALAYVDKLNKERKLRGFRGNFYGVDEEVELDPPTTE